MSSENARGSNSSDGERYAETTGSSSQLLQKMLESTLLDTKSQLSKEEWNALRSAAADAHGRNLGLTDLIEALVLQLLSLRFAHIQQDQASSKRLCHRIAVTMGSDPYARQRFDEFLQHLLRPSP